MKVNDRILYKKSSKWKYNQSLLRKLIGAHNGVCKLNLKKKKKKVERHEQNLNNINK